MAKLRLLYFVDVHDATMNLLSYAFFLVPLVFMGHIPSLVLDIATASGFRLWI